jgi:hypothetical protein
LLSIDLNGLSKGAKSTTCPKDAAIYTACIFSPSLKHLNHLRQLKPTLILRPAGQPFSRLSSHVGITHPWDGRNMYALIHAIFLISRLDSNGLHPVLFYSNTYYTNNVTNSTGYSIFLFPKILREISIPTKGKISIMQGFTSLMSMIFSG